MEHSLVLVVKLWLLQLYTHKIHNVRSSGLGIDDFVDIDEDTVHTCATGT